MTEWFHLTAFQNAANNIIFPSLLNELLQEGDSQEKLLFIGRLRLVCRSLGFNDALREEQLSTVVRLSNAPGTNPTFYQCVGRVLRAENCLAIVPNFTRHLSSRRYDYIYFGAASRAVPSILRRLAEWYERQGEGYEPTTGTFRLVALTRQAFNKRHMTRQRKLQWLFNQLRPRGFIFHLPFND